MPALVGHGQLLHKRNAVEKHAFPRLAAPSISEGEGVSGDRKNLAEGIFEGLPDVFPIAPRAPLQAF
jgi:hypothetical protein